MINIYGNNQYSFYKKIFIMKLSIKVCQYYEVKTQDSIETLVNLNL